MVSLTPRLHYPQGTIPLAYCRSVRFRDRKNPIIHAVESVNLWPRVIIIIIIIVVVVVVVVVVCYSVNLIERITLL